MAVSVCVVVPSWHYWANPFKLQPLWELYFATQFAHQFPAEEVQVTVKDLRGKRIEQGFAAEIPEHDLYFFWIMKSGDSIEIYSLVRELRAAYPQARFVAGGTHVDMRPEECAEVFDAVVTGPGEESLARIITDLRARKLEKCYRADYKNAPYSSYPFAKRDFLPDSAIVNEVLFGKYGGIPATSVQFSRGCVFSCAFCVYNVPNTMQIRTPEQMETEIAYLKDRYGVQGVNIRDEICIPPAKPIATAYLEALGRANVAWRGQTTVRATEDQLRLARDTGCVELSIGVETVDDGVMKIINKRQTQAQIRDFVANAKKLGIKVKMCLILGLPGEPRDILDRTHQFIEETAPDFVSLSGFCPTPGSPIFRDPDAFGIKFIDTDWSKHSHLLFRFSDHEEVGLPFEYKEDTPWGKGFTRTEIANNVRTLQRYLEGRGMVY